MVSGGFFIVFHGSRWFLFNGFSWIHIGFFYGSRWVLNVFHGSILDFKVPGWFSWFFMVPGWFFMFFMVPGWIFIVPGWFFMVPGVFYGFSWF